MNGGWGGTPKRSPWLNNALAASQTQLDARFYSIIAASYSDHEIERCQRLSNLAVDL